MSTDIIVSYDGTSNDDDALALGRMLAQTGATVALAYVRHSREFDPSREGLAQHDADRRLAQGATWLGDPDLGRHVVISASTGEGLERLAVEEEAALIVFGSDYRTPPGRVEPGMTAQRLLDGGTVAIAVAAAGLRSDADATIKSIGVSAPDADTAAPRTAEAIAEKLGATVLAGEEGGADLIVIGSQSTAPDGKIALGGASRALLNTARSSVIVVPRGVPVVL